MIESERLIEKSFLLAEPVSFKIRVGNRSLHAQFIASRFADGQGNLLTIKFGDGHQDEYELDAFQAHTAEGNRDEYCLALEKEVYAALWGWTDDTKVYVINHILEGKEMNIWIRSHRDDKAKKEYFSVLYDNQFHFNIAHDGRQWYTKIPDAYQQVEIDKDLLKKVITALNYYTDK